MRRIVRSGVRSQGPPEAARPGCAGATGASARGGGARELPPRRGGDRGGRVRGPNAATADSASRHRAPLRRGRHRLKSIIAI